MFLDYAIRLALRRPAPPMIPLTGERSAQNDFFSVHLEDKNRTNSFLVKSANHSAYCGLIWTTNAEGLRARIKKYNIRRKDIQIVIDHYYRGWQIRYTKPLSFVLARGIRWHRLLELYETVSAYQFARRTLTRFQRIELLQLLIEKNLHNPNIALNPVLLGVEIRSTKWFRHPRHTEDKNHLTMLFESLVESGDLSKNTSQAYKVEPKALITLSEHEKDEEKHNDSQKTQRNGNRIAIAIVAVGLIGAITSGIFC